jgi:biotin carboxyl carrier protein
MKRYQIEVAGRTFEVEVLGDPQQEEVQVAIDGETLTVRVKAEEVRQPAPAEAAAGEAAVVEGEPTPSPQKPVQAPKAAASDTVTSPLPGVIKTIAVQPGQQVAPNDELIVIEAMKMDNVIRSVRDGTIGTVFVAEGRQVSHGEPLMDYVD